MNKIRHEEVQFGLFDQGLDAPSKKFDSFFHNEEDSSVDWALLEIESLFHDLTLSSNTSFGAPTPKKLTRNQLPIVSIEDIEWVEAFGAEVLNEILNGYQLYLLEQPSKIRMITPSPDGKIQAVWQEIAELLEWSDEGIEKFCISLLDYQIQLLSTSHVKTGRSSRISNEFLDIWSWVSETGKYAEPHPITFTRLAEAVGCDGDILARTLWDTLPHFVLHESVVA